MVNAMNPAVTSSVQWFERTLDDSANRRLSIAEGFLAIDGILDRFEEELGVFPTILATGGMGRILAPYCRHRITVDDSLLLKGLGIIWKKNKEPVERASQQTRA